MRGLISCLAVTLIATSAVEASDATRQQAVEAVSFYLAVAGSCQTIIGQPDILKAAIDDSLTTLVAGGYTSEEAASVTEKMVTAVSKAKPLTLTPDVCAAEIKSITDGREKLRADLAAAR